MARKRKKRIEEAGELNMVALIDVAMQLLNFFLITAAPVAVISNLDVFRPAPDKKEQLQKPPNMIRIQIFQGGNFAINDRSFDVQGLEAMIDRLASASKEQTIMIMASNASKHEDLVLALDLCAKYGLMNLSVVSVN